MKTYCINLGRVTSEPVSGMLITLKYDMWSWSFFTELLRELITIFDTRFAGQFHNEDGNAYVTFTADDVAADLLVGMMYSEMSFNLGCMEIKQVPDFIENINLKEVELASTELVQSRDFIYPINTGADFKTDALQPLIAVIGNCQPEDRVIVQVVMQPIKDNALLHWKMARHRRFQDVIRRFNAKYWFKKGVLEELDKRINDKAKGIMYRTTIRLAAYKKCVQTEKDRRGVRDELKEKLSALVGGYGQFSDPDLNILKPTPVVYGERALRPIKNRSFGHIMLLGYQELASVWHPHDGFATTKKLVIHSPVPPEVPRNTKEKKVAVFGRSNYRDSDVEFGFSRPDLRKHLYVIGKSGMGKSCLLQLLIQNDMREGHGVAVIDPHGDLVDSILRLVPKERVNDVMILDPADRDFPASFNPLAWVPEKQRLQVTLGIVETFRKLMSGGWNDQLESLIRYVASALISTKNATMLSIERLLSDEQYRIAVATSVSDEGIKNFWLHEYSSWAEKHQGDAVVPLRDGLTQFLASDMIRNVVAQPVNKFDFRSIIDNKRILLVKVSKGLLGDENAALLGSLVVNKIYQAAMSRADIPEEKRQDFYFYIDEFQTFAAENIKNMLAESRKYHLNLILAHQVLGQLPDIIIKTIFGNVGNIVAFCLSGDDAGIISGELSGEADTVSLMNLPVRDFFVKMQVADSVLRPFSGRTLDVVYPEDNYAEECLAASRTHYSESIKQVQEIIARWNKGEAFVRDEDVVSKTKLDLRQYLRRMGTVLQLSDLDITDQHLLQFGSSAFDNVQELYLSNVAITDKSAVCIANLKNLRTIKLDGTKITDVTIKVLQMLPLLKKLVLDGTKVTDQGLLNLKGSSLEKLSLRGTAITDKSIKVLLAFKNLTEVALENTKVTKKVVDRVRGEYPNLNIHC